MELIRGLHNLRAKHQVSAVTMGGFDGIHLGHQAILERLNTQAKALNLPSTVITFEPLPREFFKPKQSPPRLTRLPEKLKIFAHHNIDQVLCLYFNRRLAEQTAEDFIEQTLVKKLGIQYLLVGEAFRFGYQRRGNIEMLSRLGKTHGYQVESLKPLTDSAERISSTRIRAALQNGDMQLAHTLLGRPYAVSGRVIAGNARGRTIGFPTANIHLKRRCAAVKGVFAVQVRIKDTNKLIQGVANIGTRPTFEGQSYLLEAHLFDFNQNLYGQSIEVQLNHKIREEQRFDSIDQLKTQILIDVEQAHTFFEHLA